MTAPPSDGSFAIVDDVNEASTVAAPLDSDGRCVVADTAGVARNSAVAASARWHIISSPEDREPAPKTNTAAEATPKPTQATAAPAAVENAVNAAGGTSAVSEPTNIKPDPHRGYAAGPSSAVAESAPAAAVPVKPTHPRCPHKPHQEVGGSHRLRKHRLFQNTRPHHSQDYTSRPRVQRLPPRYRMVRLGLRLHRMVLLFLLFLLPHPRSRLLSRTTSCKSCLNKWREEKRRNRVSR